MVSNRKKNVRLLLVGISRHLNDYFRVISLGVACLKSYADVKFKDKVVSKTLNIFDIDEAQFWKENGEFSPDIIGFSCFLWNVDTVIKICRELKKKNPKIKIFLGGPEATGRRLRLLKESLADALIVGEGEGPLADMLSRYLEKKGWDNISGVILPSYSEKQSSEVLPQIIPLENLPSPFNSEQALGLQVHPKMFYPFETMRGCPNRCAYCMWTTLGAKSVRYFPLERIRDDMEWMIKNTPQTYIFVADSDTFVNKERAMQLAPIFLRGAEQGKLRFVFQTNLKNWDAELMKAYNHPFIELNIGINTLNEKVQKLFGRVYTKQFVEKNLLLLHQFAPDVHVLMQMMYACPKETFSEFCSLFDWAWSFPYFSKMFFHTQLLSGSRMEAQQKELSITTRKQAPFYITSTAECNHSEIKTEELMILCTAIWMKNSKTSPLYKEIVKTKFKGSFSLAFLTLWTSLQKKQKSLILEFYDYLESGKDRLLDDLQLDIIHEFNVAPGRLGNSKLTHYTNSISDFFYEYYEKVFGGRRI